jgi:hypothetical protein
MTPEAHVASSQQSQRIRNNYRLTVYREPSVRSKNPKCNLCLYRKPKSVRNGDEANRGSRVTRCSRPAERDETPVHLCPTTGVFGFVVIAGISFQDPAQVRLAQDDDMVDALTPDRPLCSRRPVAAGR